MIWHLLFCEMTTTMHCSAQVASVSDFVTPWTVACQAPLSMGFPRQEYGVGCRALFQGIFLTQGSNPRLLRLLHCRGILCCWATEAQTKIRLSATRHTELELFSWDEDFQNLLSNCSTVLVTVVTRLSIILMTLVSESFYLSTCTGLACFPGSLSLAPTHLFSASVSFVVVVVVIFLKISHVSEPIRRFSFLCRISLGIMPLRSIHVASNGH